MVPFLIYLFVCCFWQIALNKSPHRERFPYPALGSVWCGSFPLPSLQTVLAGASTVSLLASTHTRVWLTQHLRAGAWLEISGIGIRAGDFYQEHVSLCIQRQAAGVGGQIAPPHPNPRYWSAQASSQGFNLIAGVKDIREGLIVKEAQRMRVRGQGGHCKDRGVRKRRERGSTFNPSGGLRAEHAVPQQ